MIKEILKDSSCSVGIKDEGSYWGGRSLISRYERAIITFLECFEFARGKSVGLWLLIIEVFLIAAGTVLGILLSHGSVPLSAKVIIGIIYLIITVVVIASGRIVAYTVDTCSVEVDRIRLMNLSERLAAEVALLTEAGDLEKKDNEKAIEIISNYVHNLSSLKPEDQEVIRQCVDPSTLFETSRGTNVVFESLDVDSETSHKLTDMSSKVIDIAYYLFGSHRLSAKVYLRASKIFEGHEIEILVSFSKYPAHVRSAYKGSYAEYGSSWVKARGNPSIVWQCLETGKSIIVTKDFDASYKSVYAICLPGRIGVLAITSPEMNAFDSKVDRWAEKSLAYSTEIQINRILNLNGQ